MTIRLDERTASSNEAALRFRLRAYGVADLADHAALRRFAAAEPGIFQAAILGFAGLTAAAADALPWPSDALSQALAAVLLEADLRPDDRLLVAGLPPWPWVAAERMGIAVVLASDATQATLRAVAAAEAATVVAAPAAWLAQTGLGTASPTDPRAAFMNDAPQSPG